VHNGAIGQVWVPDPKSFIVVIIDTDFIDATKACAPT
jgi:hypothetical protein